MNEQDIIKLITATSIIADNKDERTITVKSLQAAFRIIYMDHPMLNQCINTACTYTTAYCMAVSVNEKIFIPNFKHYDKIVRTFIKSGTLDGEYKIASNTIPYLCGLADKLNDQVHNFN